MLVRPELLAARVVGVLRERIHNREWGEFLPSERRLSEHLGVSRGTVREAIATLQREGIIEVSVGRRTRLTEQAARRRAPSSRTVGLVTKGPLLSHPTIVIYYVGELRQRLQQAGFELQLFSEKQEGARSLRRIITNLRNEARISCWLLLSVSEGLQRWFYREKLSAVVIGSAFAGVHLPSIDYDYAAMARHAVGRLLGQGHRHLALFRPLDVVAGYLAGETGFLRGVKEDGARHEATSGIYPLGTDPQAIRRKVDAVLGQREAPTGLVVTSSPHAIAVSSHLLRLGRQMPRDVSLICLVDDPHLRMFDPQIAAYLLAPKIFAERLRSIVLQAASTGHLAMRRHLIRPEFDPGQSLGPAPSVA